MLLEHVAVTQRGSPVLLHGKAPNHDRSLFREHPAGRAQFEAAHTRRPLVAMFARTSSLSALGHGQSVSGRLHRHEGGSDGVSVLKQFQAQVVEFVVDDGRVVGSVELEPSGASQVADLRCGELCS